MGKDKALIEVDGKAMIARVVDALLKAGREPIRIAVHYRKNEYAKVVNSNYNIEWV